MAPVLQLSSFDLLWMRMNQTRRSDLWSKWSLVCNVWNDLQLNPHHVPHVCCLHPSIHPHTLLFLIARKRAAGHHVTSEREHQHRLQTAWKFQRNAFKRHPAAVPVRGFCKKRARRRKGGRRVLKGRAETKTWRWLWSFLWISADATQKSGSTKELQHDSWWSSSPWNEFDRKKQHVWMKTTWYIYIKTVLIFFFK